MPELLKGGIFNCDRWFCLLLRSQYKKYNENAQCIQKLWLYQKGWPKEWTLQGDGVTTGGGMLPLGLPCLVCYLSFFISSFLITAVLPCSFDIIHHGSSTKLSPSFLVRTATGTSPSLPCKVIVSLKALQKNGAVKGSEVQFSSEIYSKTVLVVYISP